MKYFKLLVLSVLCLLLGASTLVAQSTSQGVLPGEFSVSPTKKVRFSQGNLQYHPKQKKWQFAAQQYDFITTANDNLSSNYNGWVDLFAYATSGWRAKGQSYPNYQPWDHAQQGDYLKANMVGANDSADWGVYNAISNGGNRKGLWRVLSVDEWDYLLNKRPNAVNLKFKVRIDGNTINRMGELIFPDGATPPTYLDPSNSPTTAKSNVGNDITMAQYNACINMGAVFMAAAGLGVDNDHPSSYYENYHSCKSFANVCEPDGLYWTSTYEPHPDGSHMSSSAYRLWFWNDNSTSFGDNYYVKPIFSYNCSYHKHSVRLVREIHVVKFLNYDGTVIKTEYVLHGDYATGPDVTPTRPYGCYDYIFTGWNSAAASKPILKDETFKAQYRQGDPHEFTVTFLKYDGSVLQKKGGFHCGDSIKCDYIPTRDPEDTVRYTFKHWYKKDGDHQQPYYIFNFPDTIVSPDFSSNARYYKVTWKNDMGTILYQDSVEYGKVPVFVGNKDKKSTCAYDYTFKGWQPLVGAVDGDVTYTAKYDTIQHPYNVRWLNYDSTLLYSTTVHSGEKATYTGSTPTRNPDAFNLYTFTGWLPADSTITCSDVDFVAQYSSRERFFNVSFIEHMIVDPLHFDTTVLYRSNRVEYMHKPKVDANDSLSFHYCDYDLNFRTWICIDPATLDTLNLTVNDPVTQNVIFVAQYDQILNSYNMTWNQMKKDTVIVQNYDSLLFIPEVQDNIWDNDSVYIFTGWDPDLATMPRDNRGRNLVPCSDTTFTAQYRSVPQKYEIYVEYLDTPERKLRIDTTVLEYGDTLNFDSIAVDRVYCDSTYKFLRWEPALQVVSDQSPKYFKAIYDDMVNTYTISWNNWKGVTIKTDSREFEQAITVCTDTLRAASRDSVYFFAGWKPTPAAIMPCHNEVYTATYVARARYISDTIILRDTIIYDTTEYDSTPNLKPYTYNVYECDSNYYFLNWEPTPTAQDTVGTTYKAIYNPVVNKYSVTWKKWDGTTYLTASYEYDSLIVLPSNGPDRPASADSVYFFSHWPIAAGTPMPCKNVEYTACYTSAPRYYNDTVALLHNDSTPFQIEYGKTPDLTQYQDTIVECDTIYQFREWNPQPMVQGVNTIVYTALYDSIINKHNVRWQDWDGSEILTEAYEYGATIRQPRTVPTRPSTGGTVYFFTGWDPVFDPQHAEMPCNDVVYVAQYTDKQRYYYDTIITYNDTNVLYYDTTWVAVPFDSTPNLDAYRDTVVMCDYTYEFDHWDPSVAKQDTTSVKYVARYNRKQNVYSLTWKNYDGTVNYSENYNYGDVINLPVNTPTKPADESNVYFFANWDKGITEGSTMPCNNLVCNPVFDSKPRYYLDSLIRKNDTIIVPVEYDSMPNFDQYRDTIHRCAYTYTFKQWTPVVVKQGTSVMKYVAEYDSTLNVYTLTWNNHDGSVNYTVPMNYDSLIVAPTQTPTKPADANSVYFFTGWNPALVAGATMPCNDIAYTPVFDSKPRYYLDSLIRKNDTIIVPVEYDSMPNFDQYRDTIRRCAYTYTFKQWTPAVAKQGTSIMKYVAEYDSTLNVYTLTWNNHDGSVNHTVPMNYDSLIVAPAQTPTKPADASNVYFFTGWNPALVPGATMPCNDIAYTPVFDSKPRYYLDSIIRMNDTIIVPVRYDSMPNLDQYKDTIHRCAYTYTFKQWTPAVVKQDTMTKKYVAEYDSTLNVFTLTWNNHDGTVNYTVPMNYDSLIVAPTQTPTKPADANSVYFFTGWNPALVAGVTMPCNDLAYTPVFDSKPRYYLDTLIRKNDTIIVPVEYDSMPNFDQYKDTIRRCAYTYTFKQWIPAVEKQGTSAVKYVAEYDSTLNVFTLTWNNHDGSVNYTVPMNYDSLIVAPAQTPTKPADANSVYFFAGWNPALVAGATMPCNDIAYTPVFNSKPRYYEDTLIRKNDTIIVPVEYDSMPNFDQYKDTIRRCAYTYTFKQWTPAVVKQGTSAVKYVAEYDSTLNVYTLTWNNHDGSVNYTVPMNYDSLIVAPAQTPTKPADANSVYFFTGWNPALVPGATMPCNDIAYTPVFNSKPRYYEDTLIRMNDTIIVPVEYDSMPNFDQYKDTIYRCNATYIFSYWTPNVAQQGTSATTYTAVYDSVPVFYNIVWRNDLVTVTTTSATYGAVIQTPVGIPTPTRAATQDSVYFFNGWNMASGTTMPCGDTVFYATYTSKSAYIVDTIVLHDTIVLDTVHYDSVPQLDKYKDTIVHCDYTYYFNHWTPDPTTIQQGVTPIKFTAVYDSVLNFYTITWISEGDTVRVRQLNCGDIPIADEPSKKATCESTYSFIGWTPDMVPVTGDATYTAVFGETPRYHHITWYDEDYTILHQDSFLCGETPSHPCEYRNGGDTINYHFTGWDHAVVPVDRDTYYIATYEYEERVVTYDSTMKYVRCEGDTLTLPSGKVITITADEVVNDTAYLAPRSPYAGLECYNNDYLVDINIYAISVAYYKNPLESDIAITCPDDVVEGMPIVLTETTKDIALAFTGEEDELVPDFDNAVWQILDVNGNWVEYTGTEIRDREVGDTVYVRYVIPTNCDDIIFSVNAYGCDMSVHQANADNCPRCQNDSVVIAVYDWLLMYEHVKMQAQGYNVTPDKVMWFAIGGKDWDNLNDWVVPYAIDDEYLGNGYYFTINKPFNGTKDYYSLVDVSEVGNKALPCLGIMRSQKFHYAVAPASAPQAQLYPSEVHNSDVVYVVGLESDVKNEVYVYDMAGKLVSHETVTEGHYEFRATGAAGTYRVVVVTENNKQTLSFIIL